MLLGVSLRVHHPRQVHDCKRVSKCTQKQPWLNFTANDELQPPDNHLVASNYHNLLAPPLSDSVIYYKRQRLANSKVIGCWKRTSVMFVLLFALFRHMIDFGRIFRYRRRIRGYEIRQNHRKNTEIDKMRLSWLRTLQSVNAQIERRRSRARATLGDGRKKAS
jgi:hypothetical protein